MVFVSPWPSSVDLPAVIYIHRFSKRATIGQYFILLDIDQRQCLGHLRKLGESIWTFPKHLVGVLQVLNISLPSEADLTALGLTLKRDITDDTTENRSCSTSVFDKLSTELVDAIFNQLSGDHVDCICLGLCSLRLWKIARQHIEACLRKIGCCAGDRLICIGDYAKDNDLPLGMLAAGELEELQGTIPYRSKNTLYYSGDSWPRPPYVEAWTVHRDLEMRGLHAADMKMWELLAGNKFIADPVRGAPLVLRNITTHEYVREVALDDWKHRNGGRLWRVENINLGYLCAIRICWSSDDSVSMAYEGGIHRGVWAGHRFDIVPEGGEWMLEGHWSDISEEVLRELEEIWAC